MRKFYFFIIFILWTTPVLALDIKEDKNINIIIDSNKITLSNPVVMYKDSILIPARSVLNILNVSNNNISFENNLVTITHFGSTLALKINDTIAYLNSKQVKLSVPPIIYKNTTYVPLRLIGEFLDCYVIWDNSSRSVFIKDLNDYSQNESFFDKVQKKLSDAKSVQIDIINEIKNKSSSYSFGNSIYIDRTSNKIFQKNMLKDDWSESTLTLSSYQTTTPNNFNTAFFAGVSFDKAMSDENFMIFKGFYPLKSGELCKGSIYIDPNTLYIVKQICEFKIGGENIKQSIIYTYN